MTLNYSAIIMELLGGLALFLFGMTQLTNALKKVAGDRMRIVLGKFTTNRFSALFSGAFITSIVQSSSVTTVILVGFVSAGLMTLPQSIGIIIGANIGSTVTAQIIAFKVSQYSLLILAGGFFVSFISKNTTLKRYGEMVMAIGLIFFGMELMSSATKPLQTFDPMIALMARMENPWMGIVAGMLFTAVVQSSAATTGLLLVLAGQGIINLEAGITMVLGANVGTCITALLATLGKPRAALQVALVHILYNVLGVIVWVAFIDQLANLARIVSPIYPDLLGTVRLVKETPRQIANAHTIFNVVNAVLFIGFVGPLGRLVAWLAPQMPVTEAKTIKPKYLDSIYLQTPSLAMNQVRLELGRLGSYVLKILKLASPAVINGSKEELETLARRKDVDILHIAIIDYLRRIGEKGLSPKETKQLTYLLKIAGNMENMADVIQRDFVAYGLKRIKHKVVFSKQTRQAIKPLYDEVEKAMEVTILALEENNVESANRVVAMKPAINELAEKVTNHLAKRLLTNEPDRITLYRIETDITGQIKRLYYFAKRIAKKTAEMQQCPIDEQKE